MLLAALLGGCALLAHRVSAFQFIVDDNSVNECGAVQFNFTSGTPPYQITGIGVFDMPVNVTIPDSAVTANGGAFRWENLPFNASSQVVFVMSDANGFATGGASKLYTVGSRPYGVSDCPRTNGNVKWTFAINPMDSTEETRLPQCQPVSFSWSGDFVAPVSIVGIIPNGNVIYSSSGKGKEISYPLNVALGSEIVYVSWDARGETGGTSYVMRVTDGNNKCLDGSTASTTPVPPWNPSQTGKPDTATKTSGGMVTVTAIQTVVPDGSTSLTPGAIAGIVVGVIGAVVILQALIVWFCCRKQLKSFLANRKTRRDSNRRMSGGIDLYEQHPSLLHSSASMRDNHNRASHGFVDDDLGTRISPFMGGTTEGEGSSRISMTSGTTGTGTGSGYAPLPPGAGMASDRGSDRQPHSPYPTYPPAGGNGHRRNMSGATAQSSASRLPMKMQLAMGNPDNRNVFDDGQPSLNMPVGGFRRHEDAGSVSLPEPPPDQVEDLPPTYNPQWGGAPKR